MTAGILSPLIEPISAEDPLEDAARRLVARHAAELPDLSHLVVLLPSLHAAAPLARALAAAAGHPTLLPPRFTTLPQWAAEMPLDRPLVPEVTRRALIYGALRERGWFREEDRWGLAQELAQLFDALTLYRVNLPENPDDFAQRLAEAYGAQPGTSLRFEARLVQELWQAMHRVLAGQLDQAAAYVRRLATLAQQASRPLYAIGLTELFPVEAECLAAYARRQPVCLFLPRALDPGGGAVARVLFGAWCAQGKPLDERAQALARALPASPLAGRVRLAGGATLEETVRLADLAVRRWLAEGKREIAIVAQNRLAARRLRALLERSGVLVADETGWTLSTAAASSVVMRWLDLLSGDFHHRELLDFLKSPLVFADLEAGPRREAVYQLEQLIRRRNLVSRLSHYQAAAREEAVGSLAILDRLAQARQRWPRQPQPLGRWFQALTGTLDALGITPALESDLAGAQLLALLRRLGEEAEAAPGRFEFAEWRRLLDQALEAETFRDTSIDSPVVFTHLAATRLRRFEGVILLGCGAGELPAAEEGGRFFNQAVRAELGLPTRAQDMARQRADLAALLCASEHTLALWQNRLAGEERLASPWLDLLSTLHERAWGTGLMVTEPGAPSGASDGAGGTPRPAPRLPRERVPTRISASAYNSLLACPYQYFARHVLHLNEEDEVKVEMEKQDFGQTLHRILATFHQRHPRIASLSAEAAQQALAAITAEHFEPLLRLNYLSHAWKLQWEALIPAYVAWQQAHEAEGWTFAGAERPGRRLLTLDDGQTLELVGTLDRVDTSAGGLAVIDYKTSHPQRLAVRLNRPGEDVQLPVYALLAPGSVSHAMYLSLAGGEVKSLALPRDVADEAAAVERRLAHLFGALHAGAGLPANGGEDACAFCEMAGLCRRAYWEDGA